MSEPAEMSEAPPTPISAFKPVLLVLVVAASLYALYQTPLRNWLKLENVQSLRAWASGLGAGAPVVVTLISAGLIALGAPRLVLAAASGLMFGFLLGSLLNWVATAVACMVDFWYSRWLGRSFVARRIAGKHHLERWLGMLREHGLATTILIRAAPVGHCMTFNLLMGVSPISTRDFFLGTLVGTVPGTCIYALLGSAAEGNTLLRLALGTGILLASSVLYLVYLRRLRRRRLARAP